MSDTKSKSISSLPFGFVPAPIGGAAIFPGACLFDGNCIVPDPRVPWVPGTYALFPCDRAVGDQYYLATHETWVVFEGEGVNFNLNLDGRDPNRIPWCRTIKASDYPELVLPKDTKRKLPDAETFHFEVPKFDKLVMEVTPINAPDPARKMPRLVVEEMAFSNDVVAELVELARPCRKLNAHESYQYIVGVVFERYPEVSFGSFTTRAEAVRSHADWNVAILDDHETEQVLLIKRENEVRVEVPLTRAYESTWTTLMTDVGFPAATAHVTKRLRELADALEQDPHLRVQEFNLPSDSHNTPARLYQGQEIRLVLGLRG